MGKLEGLIDQVEVSLNGDYFNGTRTAGQAFREICELARLGAAVEACANGGKYEAAYWRERCTMLENEHASGGWQWVAATQEYLDHSEPIHGTRGVQARNRLIEQLKT